MPYVDLQGLGAERYGDGLYPDSEYGRGFIPPGAIEENVVTAVQPREEPVLLPLVTRPTYVLPPTTPALPIPDAADALLDPLKVDPYTATETLPSVISPLPSESDAYTTFQLAEAKKYGYPVQTWMAMGAEARSKIRAAYPDGRYNETEGGATIHSTTVDMTSGGDYVRERYNATGGGTQQIGLEIREKGSTSDVIPTKTGLAFDDIIRVEPLTIESPDATAEAGLGTNIAKIGVLAFAAWWAYDAFLKKKPRRRARRRRRYPYASHARHLRQGWQK